MTQNDNSFAPDVLQLAIESANVGLWDYDLISKNVLWSPKMYDIVGIAQGTPLHIDSLYAIMHPDDTDRVLGSINRALEQKNEYCIEYRIIRPDNGETIWGQFTGRAVFNDNNEPVRMLGAGIDITKIKNAEALAEAADRAKSQFLANMSHEIRTPMNGVMGMAELLAATQLTPKQKNFADIIVNSGNSLLTIINDILDFSKIDAGEMTIHPESFDLVDAIEDVAILVSAKAAEKEVELAVRYAPTLPRMLVGDPGRIRQVVSNLLSNAVKFTEKGHVLVSVSGAVEPDSEQSTPQNDIAKLKFCVEDTGVGIPDERINTIFDKFTQVDNSATRAHEGTGLGLSICKSLIELMDGKIGLESTPNEGSTFWFEIDLPVSSENKKEKPIPTDVTGAHILIIDDNEVNRTILEEQTTAWNFISKSASTGEAGLELLRSAPTFGTPFDAVILDYQMPELNGLEVAKRIRENPITGNTPIIMLTSVDEASSSNQLRQLNVAGHLIKPAKASLLLETLIEALQKPMKIDSKPNSSSADLSSIDTGHREIFAPTKQTTQPDGLDILIAEDNDINRIVYQQILDRTDYRYKFAFNGRKAVDLYKDETPKIILMDVSMPVLNGLEATKEIREINLQNNTHTPIIGVTAHAMSGDMEKCIDAGMDDYLPKPISPNRLMEKVEEWLRQTEKNRAAS